LRAGPRRTRPHYPRNAARYGRRGDPVRRGAFIAGLASTLALPLVVDAQQTTMPTCREPAALRFNIVDKITRSEIGFTQGLEVHENRLYESTGRIGGTTQLNSISFDGKVTRLTDLGTVRRGLDHPQR